MVTVLELLLRGELSCVFSMNLIITVLDGQTELDEIIFSCGKSFTQKTCSQLGIQIVVSSGKTLPFIKDWKADHIDKRSNK